MFSRRCYKLVCILACTGSRQLVLKQLQRQVGEHAEGLDSYALARFSTDGLSGDNDSLGTKELDVFAHLHVSHLADICLDRHRVPLHHTTS